MEVVTLEDAAITRQELVEGYILPGVLKVFETYPVIKSAVLFVAQYWDDEASDAVHQKVKFSIYENPVIESLLSGYDPDSDSYRDGVNLPGFTEDGYDLFYAGLRNSGSSNRWWPDGGEAIPAFACYCEAGDQQNDESENYSPYCIIRRSEDAPYSIEIIGRKLRPELEACRVDE
jgi:hypothetical protein